MATDKLDENQTIGIDNYGPITLTAIGFYNLCKEYYKLLGQEIGKWPKNATITEVRFKYEVYKWRPFQKYITMWVCYSEDEKNSGGDMFDLPLDIVIGTKTPKECAIMQLESDMSDYKDDLEAMRKDMAVTKRNIRRKQEQIEKIKNA